VFTSVATSRFCLGSGLEIMVGGWQVHTLTGHSDHVYLVAFSPDGKRVASGSRERESLVKCDEFQGFFAIVFWH